MYPVIRQANFAHCPIYNRVQILLPIHLNVLSLEENEIVWHVGWVVASFKHWGSIDLDHSDLEESLLSLDTPADRRKNLR